MGTSIKKGSQKAFTPSKKTPYSLIKHKYRGRRFVVTLHGAKPENCPLLELLKKQFQQDMYTVVAVGYETGQHGIHPHWQIYLQVEPRVSNMKSILSSALDQSGQEQNLHIEVAKGTQAACLNYVYAVRKEHELGWVQYAKGKGLNLPLEFRPQKVQNLLWLRYNMKPWQTEITERLTGRPSYRDILYVHEPVGNTGKSYLTKYLHYFHGAIVTGGKAADMKHAVARWRQITGQYPIIIIFDIARSDQLNADSYRAIQQMKNSMFFSGKYESGMVAALLPPHILVFANCKPNIPMMSIDRWVIRFIDPKTQSLVDDN